MASRLLVDLEELSLDCPDPCHQPVQLRQEGFLILLRFLDEVRRPAMMNPLQGIGELAVQEMHALLQVEKLLAKLALLDQRWLLG
jgi:hypothetical protein